MGHLWIFNVTSRLFYRRSLRVKKQMHNDLLDLEIQMQVLSIEPS